MLALFACAAAVAQSPADLFEKAPPDVDQALRARINKFYQFHVDGKFRAADALVAEDSKDFFFAANKPRYLGCEVNKIAYLENFAKAKATVVCQTILPMIGFADKPVAVPLPSLWKVVDGEWYWYVDPDAGRISPFGKMKSGDGAGSDPGALLRKGPTVPSLWQQVQADQRIITLNPKRNSTGQVTITNQMPGSVTLGLEFPQVPGLELKLDRAELKAGQSAILSARSEAGIRLPQAVAPNSAITIRVVVQPTNQTIPVQVVFSPAN